MIKLAKIIKPPYGDGVDVMIGWCMDVISETETHYFLFQAGTFGASVLKESCITVEIEDDKPHGICDREQYFI